MREAAFSSVMSRDVVRRDIQRQTQRFLQSGGKIEHLSHKQADAKPVSRAWRYGYNAGTFE